MYKIAFTGADIGRLYYELDEKPIPLTNLTDVDANIRLVNEPYEFYPNQWRDGRFPVIQVSSDEIIPGNYQVISDSLQLANLSFNTLREESDFRFYTQENMSLMFSGLENVQIFRFDDPLFQSGIREAGMNKIPLWRYCLSLALLFLMVETLLIRFVK
jgi:hypothetical protein